MGSQEGACMAGEGISGCRKGLVGKQGRGVGVKSALPSGSPARAAPATWDEPVSSPGR